MKMRNRKRRLRSRRKDDEGRKEGRKRDGKDVIGRGGAYDKELWRQGGGVRKRRERNRKLTSRRKYECMKERR